MSRNAGRLGWVLVWAVVFCNVGTSVYYVPGLLHRTAGVHAGFFVLAVMVAFVVLGGKEVEATRRFPGGGGVVSVADRAFGGWWGCLAGQLLLVDFLLTVAISAASGVRYLEGMLPVGAGAVPVTIALLVAIGVLNVIGLKESARVSLGLAAAALVVDVVVILAAVTGLTPEAAPWSAWRTLGTLPAAAALTSFGGAWLALAGLESMSQLAPAMRDLGATPRRGMVAVIGSVVVTAPVITFLATTSAEPGGGEGADRLVAGLAGLAGGVPLAAATTLTAASLLLFGANTAVISTYHVADALIGRGFLPDGVGELSRRFQTPVRAIVAAVGIPALLVFVSEASLPMLGDLYAFGLLGAFVVGSAAMDVLRWRDGERGLGFWLGVAVSLVVLAAFAVNLVVRPHAAAFGGTVAGLGMAVAVATRRGWFEALSARLPGLRPPTVVARADVHFLTLAQARTLPASGDPAGILVASRGASPKLFREAVDRARSRGTARIFLLYVDEVPGLLYPQLVSPTPEGLTVLESGCSLIRSLGGEPVPVWGISHSAAATVAEAAEACACDTVVIGATQRTFLWHALRGRFIQELLRQLPPEIRLIVVG